MVRNEKSNELSECGGHSGGTRVQSVQATVSRTWCLLTRVRVFLRPVSDLLGIRIVASVKHTCNSLDLMCSFKGWTWAASDCLCLALVQRMDMGNCQIVWFMVVFVWT